MREREKEREERGKQRVREWMKERCILRKRNEKGKQRVERGGEREEKSDRVKERV